MLCEVAGIHASSITTRVFFGGNIVAMTTFCMSMHMNNIRCDISPFWGIQITSIHAWHKQAATDPVDICISILVYLLWRITGVSRFTARKALLSVNVAVLWGSVGTLHSGLEHPCETPL